MKRWSRWLSSLPYRPSSDSPLRPRSDLFPLFRPFSPPSYRSIRPTERLTALSDSSIVARPLAFTPRRTSHLLHLLLSLSTLTHILSLLSYLLSPTNSLLLLLLRFALQLQLTNPRRTHPTRSLRLFVLVLWAPVTVVGVVLHALWGSEGTKGEKGWAQGGLVLDFIGQGATPSKLHLLLLDVLLALVQLTTLIVAFGATVPSDLETSTSASAGGGGEAAREYGGLLGEEDAETFGDDEEEGEDGEDEEGEERRSGIGRRTGRYVGLEDLDEDVGDEDGGASTSPSLAAYGPLKPSSLSSSSPSHVVLPPVADIRLRVFWRELRHSAATSARVREDRRAEDVEEGRGAGGEV